MHIGIVGFGVVGRALCRMIEGAGSHRIAIYDKYVTPYSSPDQLRAVNNCDLVFVAVPTPFDPVKNACDVSILREVVELVSAPLCIKSTVPPGTTDLLRRETGKKICFSPEYLGEASGHPWAEAYSCGFVILSGAQDVCTLTRQVYESAPPIPLQIVETDTTTAELAKYMENCFLAMKVAFVNQFFDLATAAGSDFQELRRLFLLDDRVGASHTEVTAEHGFGGKCLPKDISAIVAWAKGRADTQLLEAVARYKNSLCSDVSNGLGG